MSCALGYSLESGYYDACPVFEIESDTVCREFALLTAPDIVRVGVNESRLSTAPADEPVVFAPFAFIDSHHFYISKSFAFGQGKRWFFFHCVSLREVA